RREERALRLRHADRDLFDALDGRAREELFELGLASDPDLRSGRLRGGGGRRDSGRSRRAVRGGSLLPGRSGRHEQEQEQTGRTQTAHVPPPATVDGAQGRSDRGPEDKWISSGASGRLPLL